MKYKHTTDIKNNSELRASFNQLAHQTFNIDFENWFQKGYWGDTYKCHSIVKDNQVISNVSTTEMIIKINGKILNSIQIGTVMTMPEYRNLGLSSELLKNVLNQYENNFDLMFLFPNESVMNFYPKFGFELVNDYKYSLSISKNNNVLLNLKKLNVSNNYDLVKIYDFAKNRIFLSSKFETLNSESILMWYCINIFNECIYYSDEFNCILIFDIVENEINIYDIISVNYVSLIDIVGRLSNNKIDRINLHFLPDIDNCDKEVFTIEKNESIFTKQPNYFKDDLIAYPIMAHT